MPYIIRNTGLALFWGGVILFGTETRFQFLLSTVLMLTGFLVMRWIMHRYDFEREEDDYD